MKNFGFKLVYAVATVVMIFNVVFEVYNSIFFKIEDLPQGKFVSSQDSPDGSTTVNLYSLKNTIGCAVRGEAVTVENGVTKRRNIFWQTDILNAEVSWAEPSKVVINGVEIDLAKGASYDSRRGTSLFQDGSLEGDAADKIQQVTKK